MLWNLDRAIPRLASRMIGIDAPGLAIRRRRGPGIAAQGVGISCVTSAEGCGHIQTGFAHSASGGIGRAEGAIGRIRGSRSGHAIRAGPASEGEEDGFFIIHEHGSFPNITPVIVGSVP